MQIDARDLIVLSLIPGIGSQRLRALVNHFRGTTAILGANAPELCRVEGIDRKTAAAVAGFLRSPSLHNAGQQAGNQLSRLNKAGGRIITCWDSEYPAGLKAIYDPPPFLFVRGSLVKDDERSVAIVGTRKPTGYGSAAAERFATGLAETGITVISGLARGIDTVAHAATLRAGGRTVAVIGSGVDRIYPSENIPLAERILLQGAVLSEFEMGAKPDAVNFPRRNRIISGISLGTVVVETGIEGGAMITAAMALDQNREVFAIPAPVSPGSRSGTNHLIREGKALLVESVDDVLAVLRPLLGTSPLPGERGLREPPPIVQMSLFEEQVYRPLSEHPVHIDVLATESGLKTSDALVYLLALEFKGAVKQLPGKFFVRA